MPDEWLAYSAVRQINFSNEVTPYKQAAADPQCHLQKFVEIQRYDDCFAVVVDFLPTLELASVLGSLQVQEGKRVLVWLLELLSQLHDFGWNHGFLHTRNITVHTNREGVRTPYISDFSRLCDRND